jgi:hypothetical protein
MLGEDLVSGIAMGEQGDKAKDILGRVYEYFRARSSRLTLGRPARPRDFQRQ